MATRTKKALIGCGVGCAVLILAVIAVGISFTIWVRQPGVLVEPQKLLFADTSGYVVWTLRQEDPGTLTMVESLIEATQQLPRQLDPALTGWLAQMQNRRNERAIREMLPMVIAWSQRPGQAARDSDQLFTLSLRNFGNRLKVADWILGFISGRNSDISSTGYKGESIYELGSEGRTFVFFIREGTVFFTSSVESGRSLVDNLEATGPSSRPATDLERLLGRTPEGNALRGAVSNINGEWNRLWQTISSKFVDGGAPGPWEGLEGVTIHGGFTEERSFDGRLRFYYDQATLAQLSVDSLDSAFASIEAGLKLEVQGGVREDHVEVSIRIPDLPAQLNRLVMEDDFSSD